MTIGKVLTVVLLSLAILGSLSFAQDSSNEIIIESLKGGINFDCYDEYAGNWANSTGKSAAPGVSANLGSRYLASNLSGSGEARFTPNIPEDGNYEVFVTWPKQANAMRVIIRIVAGGKTFEVQKIMDGWGGKLDMNGDKWQSVGVYKFSKGKKDYAAIIKPEAPYSPPDTRNSARIYADAVKFVKTADAEKQGADDSFAANAAEGDSSSQTQQQSTVAAPTPQPEVKQEAAPSAVTINWMNNIKDAMEKAKDDKKKILLYFYSKQSEECQKYESQVFSDGQVSKKLKKTFVCVLLDFNQNYEYSLNLGVFRAPSFIIYEYDGKPLTKIEGFKNKDDFYTAINAF